MVLATRCLNTIIRHVTTTCAETAGSGVSERTSRGQVRSLCAVAYLIDRYQRLQLETVITQVLAKKSLLV